MINVETSACFHLIVSNILSVLWSLFLCVHARFNMFWLTLYNRNVSCSTLPLVLLSFFVVVSGVTVEFRLECIWTEIIGVSLDFCALTVVTILPLVSVNGLGFLLVH